MPDATRPQSPEEASNSMQSRPSGAAGEMGASAAAPDAAAVDGGGATDDTAAAPDAIPLEDAFTFNEPNEAGMSTALFYAFNTVITLQAFGNAAHVRAAMEEARDRCRFFERLFSRTLPHSDIARLNAAAGAAVEIHPETLRLLQAAQRYCALSQGAFDITIGAAARLWNFHTGAMPSEQELAQAVRHVNWEALHVWEEAPTAGADAGSASAGAGVGGALAGAKTPQSQGAVASAGRPETHPTAPDAPEAPTRCFARLDDPHAGVDAGGIAKGYIADDLANLFAQRGLEAFVVNLGGNVVAHGTKPDGTAWKIGLQDPKRKDGILGAIQLTDASAVTSGVYERGFERAGRLYHHILNPRTGMPAETDAAGVTVVADASLDAEGFSTTLLALGIARGAEFAKARPEIQAAYFVDRQDRVVTVL